MTMDDMEACSLTLWGHVGLLFVAWQCSDKYLLIRGSHFKPAHLLSSMFIHQVLLLFFLGRCLP